MNWGEVWGGEHNSALNIIKRKIMLFVEFYPTLKAVRYETTKSGFCGVKKKSTYN